MRKYQQLCLIIISLLSVTVLLMYKSENSRLKYVLEVVNFFGRTDAASALVRVENNTKLFTSVYDFGSPLPVWTRLGNDFHAYSAFWHKQGYVAGGEVITLVAGLEHAVINFRCQIQYSSKGVNNLVTGKFGFIRVEHNGPTMIGNTEKFVILKFLCKVNLDFGNPENVIFTDTKTHADHFIPIRNMDNKQIKSKLSLVVCLDMIPYNLSSTTTNKNISDTSLLEFFIHHQLIGVDEFIVYDRNRLNTQIKEILYHNSIKLNLLPYNFPFQLNNELKNRAIIEVDCLMRTSNSARFVILSTYNEFIYPRSNLKNTNPVFKTLVSYSDNINRFEVNTKSVCMDPRKKIFSDNIFYNVDAKSNHPFYIYRPEYKFDNTKTIELDSKLAVVHRYINCNNKTNLYDWRTSLKPEHLAYVNKLGNELRRLL